GIYFTAGVVFAHIRRSRGPVNGGPLDSIPTGRYRGNTMKATQHAETTRQRILRTAFEEFYRNGFQAGSLNHIVEETGVTKGAFSPHFASKQELGYAVGDEVIWPRFQAIWVEPLEQSVDPIRDLKRVLRRMADEGPGDVVTLDQGCPLNNLAQEMSPL